MGSVRCATLTWRGLVSYPLYLASIVATEMVADSKNGGSLAFPIPSTPNTHIMASVGTKNLYNGRSPYRGAVAQLGERFNGIEEVRSSSLLSSTIFHYIAVAL